MSVSNAGIDTLLSQCQHGENRACYELFRRALAERDERAWEAVYTQYHRLVRSWLSRHTTVTDDLVQETFLKFSRNIPREGFTTRLENLALVLDLLRRCARSVAIDAWRKEQRREALEQTHVSGLTDDRPHSLEESTIQQLTREALYQRIQARLQGEEERLLFHLSYVLGLTPRQIAASYDEQFEDIQAIYRIKERVLSRLRADEQLRQLWYG